MIKFFRNTHIGGVFREDLKTDINVDTHCWVYHLIPETGMTFEEIVEAVLAYERNHPEDLNENEAMGVSDAIQHVAEEIKFGMWSTVIRANYENSPIRT